MVEQADAADEAQGGTRTAGQGAALCPRWQDGRGHRFAADPQCWTCPWYGPGTSVTHLSGDMGDSFGASGGAPCAGGARHPCESGLGLSRRLSGMN